jgi:hypothetical protein
MESIEATQPMLLVFEEDCLIKQIFMKLDAHAIEIKNNKMFIYAIDMLFKCYWIFNLEYPAQAINLIYFLESIFDLGISVKRPSVDIMLHNFSELGKSVDN